MDYEDPGWRRALKLAGPYLLLPPPFGLAMTLRRREVDGLTSLRAGFIRITSGLLLISIVVMLLTQDGGQEGWVSILVIAAGLIALGVVQWARSRALNATSSEALAGSYRGQFFIGMGMGFQPTMFGFVGVSIDGSLWHYLLGLTFSIMALALIAPTRADISRRQEQIQAQGSSLSLGRALMETPSSG